MPDRMTAYMSDRMPYRLSEYMTDQMADRMPTRMPDGTSEYMSGGQNYLLHRNGHGQSGWSPIGCEGFLLPCYVQK